MSGAARGWRPVGRARRRQGGFTLTELLIVVAIIGVLSAIAVPKYQDYVGRAQAAEAFTATAGLRTQLAVYHAEHGSFESVATDSTVTESASAIEGRYIGGVSELSVANTGVSDKANAKVSYQVDFDAGVHNGKSITIEALIRHGQIRGWKCRSVGQGQSGIGLKYLPTACREAR